jgi:hypothetical protein
MKRVAIVTDKRTWSYEFTAVALRQHLTNAFAIEIFCYDSRETLRDEVLAFSPDLLVDMWWKGTLANAFREIPAIKQVSSHRWERRAHGGYNAAKLAALHLRRNAAVIVPSARLHDVLQPVLGLIPVELCPKGFHPETFSDACNRYGDLVVGWAGDENAVDKNLHLLREACPELLIAGGQLPQSEMPAFYNGVDVITCASDAEGDPRPLIEGMACGCFPIMVDVGVVPELVRHGENGLIVDRNVEAFRDAFAWCRSNLDYVRAAGQRNAQEMLASRTWAHVSSTWADAFDRAIK